MSRAETHAQEGALFVCAFSNLDIQIRFLVNLQRC